MINSEIISRVIQWNEQRYERVYSYQLAESLLLEELSELYEANDSADILDAVGDFIFVFIGVLWKLHIDISDIVNLFCEVSNCKTLIEYSSTSDSFVDFIRDKYILSDNSFFQVKRAAHSLFVHCISELRKINMQDRLSDILKVICDSNDTKEIPIDKLHPNVKANTNKGNKFVSPTSELNKLLMKETKNGIH